MMTHVIPDVTHLQQTIGVNHSSTAQRLMRSPQWILGICLTTSVVLNILLAGRLSELRPRQGLFSELHVGATVPPITGTTADGQQTTIVYEGTGRPTILYVFRPQCIWCARNINNVRALVATKGDEDRFIGLSLSEDGLTTYLASHQLTIPVVTHLSLETIKAYSLGATPQTIVVSPHGQVVRNWPGAWTGKQKADVEGVFHVTLPGLDWTASTPSAQGQPAVTEKSP